MLSTVIVVLFYLVLCAVLVAMHVAVPLAVLYGIYRGLVHAGLLPPPAPGPESRQAEPTIAPRLVPRSPE